MSTRIPHRLLHLRRQIGITEPQCPVPVGPQPDAISDPCQNLFINVPAIRSPVIFMQQSVELSFQLQSAIFSIRFHSTSSWRWCPSRCPWRGTSRHGGVLGGGTSRTRLGEDGASRPRLLRDRRPDDDLPRRRPRSPSTTCRTSPESSWTWFASTCTAKSRLAVSRSAGVNGVRTMASDGGAGARTGTATVGRAGV